MDSGLRLLGRVDGGNLQPTLQDWKTGQILKALVVTGTPPEAGGGRAVLRIGGGEYSVRSQTPLHAGESVRLQVRRTGPQIQLQLQRAEAPPANGRNAASAEPPLLATVKSLLSLQLPPAQGLQILMSKLALADARTARQLAPLARHMPNLETLGQADALRAAVERSGNFLEAKLQLGQPPTTGDLKLQLAQALQALEPAAPTALLNTLQGIQARITLNQLHSTLETSSAAQNHWLIELPFRTQAGFQTLRLEVEADRGAKKSADERSSAHWSVRLEMELPRLGPIEARITHIDGTVSARFWATRGETLRLIQGALPDLQAAWRSRGITPGVVDALQGPAPEQSPSQPWTEGRLVDKKA